MTKTYFPFDAGSGANVTEDQWRKMAQHWLPTGVLKAELNQLEVFADGSGMNVRVKSGKAWIRGHYFESDAQETLAVGAADATNPRIDRVVVRVDFTTNTIDLAVLQGVPAVAPAPPALTQSTAMWEISLVQVRVNAAVVSIAADKVTDERTLAANQALSAATRVYLTAAQSLVNNASAAIAWNAESFDTDNFHDNATNPSRITIPTTGIYDIMVAVAFAANATGARQVEVRVNGSTTRRAFTQETGKSVDHHVLLNTMLSLTAGNYLEIFALQNSGGALNLLSSEGEGCILNVARRR